MSARPTSNESVADVLREHPPALDEVSKARGEKQLLEALRAGASPRVAHARPSRARWVAVAGVGLAAAAALVVFLGRGEGPPVARFELRDVAVTSQRGTLEEGSSLETGEHEVADLRVADSRVRIEPSSRLRLSTLTADRLDVELLRGEVRVEFHPRERGREHLTVATEHARVEVVGTVFTVRATEGGTEVSVTEGVVRVVPHDGSEVRTVRAGESTRVVGHDAQARADVPMEPPEGEGPSDDLAAGPEAIASAEPAPAEAAEPTVPGANEPRRPEPSPAARLAEARRMLADGRTAQADASLRALVTSRAPAQVRAEAWTLLADMAQRAGRLEEAASDYERAASEGRGTMVGPNAIYALARLQERRLGDAARARASYARYLEEAPSGPLAHQATQALCRLGDSERCEVAP